MTHPSFDRTPRRSGSAGATKSLLAGCGGIGCLGVLVIVIVAAVAAANGSHKAATMPAHAPAPTAPTARAAHKVVPPPANQVLMTESGDGIKTTQKVTVSGNWDLYYSYNCAAFGGTGNFSVANADPSADIVGGDNAVYVNELGSHRSDVTHEHFEGSERLALEVDSECAWKVRVVQLA